MRKRDAEANKEYTKKYYHRHRIAIRIKKNLGLPLHMARFMVRSGYFPNTVERIINKCRSSYP